MRNGLGGSDMRVGAGGALLAVALLAAGGLACGAHETATDDGVMEPEGGSTGRGGPVGDAGGDTGTDVFDGAGGSGASGGGADYGGSAGTGGTYGGSAGTGGAYGGSAGAAGTGTTGPTGAGGGGAPPDYQSGENYGDPGENAFVETATDNLATFAIDVDTASYSIMRRDVTAGVLPVPAGVRVEEYVNYFDYRYEPPADPAERFAIHLETAPSFFGDGLQLLRVGIKGQELAAPDRGPANLVFLIDVSGSMWASDKLPLVQTSLRILVDALRPDDTVGLVVYAGAERIVLEPTPAAERTTILAAIDALGAGGSTNGEAGIRAAYTLAHQAYREGGINRVVLCTDGDFNVGVTGDELIALIEDYRDRGVTLTTLGFGRGNYNDYLMEQLADHGNGNYAYIDREAEADRVLRRELLGTLFVIAKDVKIQVAFDPDTVVRYRLVGYENRALADDQFQDDRVDAGEIGSGHDVTAFLELELAEGVEPGVDPRRLAQVAVRYKEPEGDVASEVTRELAVSAIAPAFDDASASFRFGAAVAEFAEILRGGQYSDGARLAEVQELAGAAREPTDADQAELVLLVERAASLWP